MLETPRRYSRLVDAWGAREPDPCSDKYVLTIVPFPKRQGEHLFGGETWETEHVLDGQIFQIFFRDMMTKQWAQIPKKMKTMEGKQVTRITPTTSQYFEEFWSKRTQEVVRDKKKIRITAMEHLLRAFPGTDLFTDELTLLGHNMNQRKGLVFGEEAKNCIGKDSWEGMDFGTKVHTLRQCVLLAKV